MSLTKKPATWGQTAAYAACLALTLALTHAKAAETGDKAVAAETASRADRDVEFNVVYTADGLGNVHGGNRRGWVYQGKVEFILAADLEKLAGLEGLSFYTNGFSIHNTGRIRRDYVGGINTIAAIEGVPRNRLSELWLEKEFAGGKVSLRLGQLAADVEFFFSGLSALFLQSDWPTIAAANLPSGGPADPLSTPGLRFKIEPEPGTSMLFAIFNGNPARPGDGDEQVRNRHGLEFRTSDPALLMGEAQFRKNHGKDDTGLARTLKFGGWHHHARFDHRRFAHDGTLLADPAGSGIAASRKSNSGLYAVVEQQLHRPNGGDAESGVSLFGRVSTTRPDRNLINFFIDGGILFAGMVPGRAQDKFGVSMMYARFSNTVRAFDRDLVAFTAATGPIRDHEANIEFTYSALVASGWSLQPVVTFVRHPSGDASRNATVMGVRSLLRF
jgi:porin